MMIRCIAVDDEPMALDKLKSYIERIPFLELAGLCSSTYDAMKILSVEHIDAMFIDINMPDINGLDFVKALADPPMIVFSTAYAEYAVESYKVHAVDYLLKPYGFAEFQNTALHLQKHHQMCSKAEPGNEAPASSEEQDVLYLKVDYRYVRAELKEIMYIEGMNEYLKIHPVSGDPFLTHTTFRQIKEKLPECFIQIHRSYIVNMKHVKEVERSVVMMTDGTRISISDSNKDIFMRYLQKLSIKK